MHTIISSGDRLIDLCIVFLTRTHVVPVLYAVTFFNATVLLYELRRLQILCSAQVDWSIFYVFYGVFFGAFAVRMT